MNSFTPLFSTRVWHHVWGLVAGATLAPGHRTVMAALRVLGLGHARCFQNCHRVLNRAVGSSLEGSRMRLRLLVPSLAPTRPLLLGMDHPLERRRGVKIQAKSVYRDAVRSSHSHLVKAMGPRWASLMRLAHMPWAGRV